MPRRRNLQLDELVETVLERVRAEYLERLEPADLPKSYAQARAGLRVRVSKRLVRAVLLAFADVAGRLDRRMPRELFDARERLAADYRAYLRDSVV